MKTENEILKDKFDLKNNGFYDVTFFIDTKFGFSFKKNFGNDEKHLSLFHFLIPNKIYDDVNVVRKPLIITVVYGKKTEDGVIMRSSDPRKFSEPIDLDFRDEFFYDIKNQQLYKKDKKIEANELLNEVYRKHIKPTRQIRGLFLRFKLRLWRVWAPFVLSLVSLYFAKVLRLVSGDKYSYNFLFKEETLNGEIISSRFEDKVDKFRLNHDRKPQAEVIEKKAREIDFFGFSVPQWPILFYSVVHLMIWFAFKYFKISTEAIENFLNNGFLVILYAVVSFWLIETVLPYFLKKFIKWFSTLAALSEYKSIRA